jgi:GT2 family glycosyltransferase
MEPISITAVVTAYTRTNQTIATIQTLLECRPPPNEVLVHVDGGQDTCASSIRKVFPGVRIIVSDELIGPGGGRNKLMAAARNELIASFDDDSYPYDPDFFARAWRLFELFPHASVIGGRVIHPHEPVPGALQKIAECGSFCGCAVVFRRRDLIQTGGYIPLPIAYGAEEEDMSLRLFDRRMKILVSPWLRVFHDTPLEHHKAESVNAQVVANIGMLVFIRYPKRYWLFGLGQVANRIVWCIRVGRWRGILRGVFLLPAHIWRHRALRQPVSPLAFRAKRRASKAPLYDF